MNSVGNLCRISTRLFLKGLYMILYYLYFRISLWEIQKKHYICNLNILKPYHIMYRKLLFLCWVLLVSMMIRAVPSFPQVSTSQETYWYFLKFTNSGLVLEANKANTGAHLAAMTGVGAQLWKVEGTATAGYTLTNKMGLQLFVTDTQEKGMVQAAKQHANNKFSILPCKTTNFTSSFEIHPKANALVAFNQWGGAGVGHPVGLWTSSKDKEGNNAIVFETTTVLEAYKNLPPLIPYPQEISLHKEKQLDLRSLQVITFPDDSLKGMVQDFAEELKKHLSLPLSLRPSPLLPADGSISLMTDQSISEAEAYMLTVTPKQIVIKASHQAGFFYALQTLRQLMPKAFYTASPSETVLNIPALDIKDKPQLTYRGYMLDVARHFFDKTEVKRILDIMSFYKMNRLHWHLTDDQGWRIEIPEYPRLTQVGSRRKGSFVSDGTSPGFFDDTEYGRGMYYTLDDLREIVAYAAERNIEIIPEIDMPGHMVAALAAYPELSCHPERTYQVRINSGISKDVLNIGDDKVIDFLKTVLDNVAKVFPGRYIHLGGDECPTDRWKENTLCQQRIKDNNLNGVGELQPWLVHQLAVYLKKKYNKDIVAWDELIETKTDNYWKRHKGEVSPLIMAWNLGLDGSGRWTNWTDVLAASKGFHSVIVPYNVLYLDWMQVGPDQADVNEGYRGGWGDNNVNSVEKIYKFDPLERLRKAGKVEYGLGVQGNMWTETTNNNAELEYQLLPRLLALSEIAWLPHDKKEWLSFFYRLQAHRAVFESRNMTYAKHFFLPEDKSELLRLTEEAEALLAGTHADKVGYASKSTCEVLANTVEAVKKQKGGDEAQQAETLRKALEVFKAAPITQPVAGKVYRLFSASTYYKAKYAGATLYADEKKALRVHYTDQQEPEELFTFVPAQNGWILKALSNDQQVTIGAYDQPLRFTKNNGTPLRIDRASVPAQQYDYVPGAVVLSKVDGYSTTATGRVSRLYIKTFGGDRNNDVPAENKVVALDNPTLCHPGTWHIVEADFRQMLIALLQRCDRIVEDVLPNEEGQYTQVAIKQLQKELLPARDLIAKQSPVSQEQYEIYVKAYQNFVKAPKTTAVDAISSDRYYVIRSAHPNLTDYVAQLKNGYVVPTSVESPISLDADPTILWQLIRQENGTFNLLNRADKKYAAVQSATYGGRVIESKMPYSWTIRSHKQGEVKGFLLIADASNYGWSLPLTPTSTSQVTLQSLTQWNNIWKLEPTAVSTALSRPSVKNDTLGRTYDLSGRVTSSVQHGVVIDAAGQKHIR